MIFPCADCPFCSVGSVQVGRHELELNLVFVHDLYEVCRAFVVEDLKFWFESTIGKVFIYRLMCSCYFGSSSIFKGSARMELESTQYVTRMYLFPSVDWMGNLPVRSV